MTWRTASSPTIGEEAAVWAFMNSEPVDRDWLGRILRVEYYDRYIPPQGDRAAIWKALELHASGYGWRHIQKVLGIDHNTARGRMRHTQPARPAVTP